MMAFKEKIICMQRSSALAWVLISLWSSGNAMMLWYFKEQAYWSASVCMVAR